MAEYYPFVERALEVTGSVHPGHVDAAVPDGTCIHACLESYRVNSCKATTIVVNPAFNSEDFAALCRVLLSIVRVVQAAQRSRSGRSRA